MPFPFKRFFSTVVLFSFFFQTLWPSVVFAEGLLYEIPSRSVEATGSKRHYLSLGVQVSDTFEDKRGEPFSQHKSPRIKVDFDQGLENLRTEVQKSLDIQSLYPGLQVTEKGLSWSALGVSFLMSYQGTLLVYGPRSVEEQRKNPILRLFNPHGDIILGEGLEANHIQVRAKDVLQQGNSRIEKLEVWAQGGQVSEEGAERTTEQGQFKIDTASTLTTKFLTIHQGATTNKGKLSLLADGLLEGEGNTLTNKGVVEVGTGVTVRHISDFQNEGTIRGGGLTLDQTTLTNTDIITLDDLATLGGAFYNNSKVMVKRWKQGGKTFVNASGAIFKVEEQSDFGAGDVKNKGALILNGDSRGIIDSFLNEGSLTMASISGLYVRDFTSRGNFEVTGPMTWSGSTFKTAKTTFKGKTSITASFMETGGNLTAESDLNLIGNWVHKSDTAKIANLSLKGKSFINEEGATVTVAGSSKVEVDKVHNKGTLHWESSVQGRIGELLNQGDLAFKGDAKLIGTRIINERDFRALAVFDWVGETLENRTTGRMTLFDNRVIATRQVINQGLLLWTHNTFRTWHFLNMGWAEVTRNLLTTALPADWRVPTDKSTTFKKSTVENRGTLKLAPTDYTPRMTISRGGDFAHWSNKGKMQLAETHLQAKSFKNDGDLAVEGPLTGSVETFENTQTAIFRGTVNLTGRTFTSTGAMNLANNAVLKVDSLITGSTFTAEVDLTLEGVDWTNLEGSKADIARLLFKGKSIGNDGNLQIRELLGSPSARVIALLRNGHTNSPKDEKKRPLFRILKGGASFTKVANHGKLVLDSGQYRFQQLTNPSIIEADAFLPEGKDSFTFEGNIHAKSLSLSSFQGNKLINRGQATFDTASFTLQTLENAYGATLTLFGYGTAHINTLRNSGIISLNQRADMVVDILQNSSGTIESSQNSLRVLLLDPGQTAKSDAWHPMLKLRKEHGGLLDMGKFKAKGDLLIEIADSLNPACYLHLYADKWQCGGVLRLYGDTFWARWEDKYAGAIHIKVRNFQNDLCHLIFRSLKIESDRFNNGKSNTEMGYIETQPDVKKPDADTSLEIIVKGDVDNRYGKMFGHGDVTLRSTEGAVLSGESVQQTKSKSAWESSISFPYHNPNESFISSNKDITLQGRNVFLKLAQVKSRNGHLYLIAERNVRSLASDVYAKAGITINGIRFDNEIFESLDWYPAPRTQNHTPGNEHMKYDYREQPQRSRHSSLRSLGTIRFNTQITRSFGSHILASKSLIDKKGKRWRGKTTSASRPEDQCDFIAYEAQSLPTGWQEFSDRDGWSRYHNGGANCVPCIVEAGEDIEAETSHFRNTGSLSSVTMTLSAGEAAFQHMGAPAQAALKLLMDFGFLSVRHVVEPDITSDGLVTQQPNGTVREKGTSIESKRAIPLSRLPIIGQRYLGAPAHTQMYIKVSFEMEKLQQMMAYTMGRLYDQGLNGEAIFDEYVREGQRQGELGALVDIRQNQSSKAFLAWSLEKMKNAKTEEEALIAVMNLFVPEALRTSQQTGEVRTQKRLDIQTDRDLTLEGAKLRSEEEKVKAKVGGDLNATAHVTTHGAYENFHQTAQPTVIEAPKDSVDMAIGGTVNVSGIDVLAEKHIGIGGKRFVGRATRLESHSINHQGKKKTTTHTVHHEVDKYRTTGVGSTIDLTSEAAPFYEEAPVILTGPVGKARIEAPGIAVVDVHDEYHSESIEKQSSGGMFGGSSTVRDVEQSSRSRGAEFNNILELIDTTGKTGITLVGADCSKVTKVIFDCEEGLIALRAGINAYMKFHSEEDKNAVWQSYEHEMRSSKTYTPCRFSPNCEFEIKSRIPVLVEQVRGQTLNWVEPLRKNLEKNGGTINLQELDEIHTHDHVSQQGPTAAASLVIALAITVCTAGTMAHAGAAVATTAGLTTTTTVAGVTATTLTAAGTVVQAMTAATLTSLTVSAANCVVNNLDNPGKALQDFLKTDTLKAAMTAAAAAGLVSAASQFIGSPATAADATTRATEQASQAAAANPPVATTAVLPTPTLAQSLEASIAQHAQFQAVNAAANIVADAAITGRSPDLRGGVVNAAISAAAATAANSIAFGVNTGFMNKFGQFMSHLGVGAGMGAALGGKDGIASGILSAAVAESIATLTAEDPAVTKTRAQEKAKTQGMEPTRKNLASFIKDDLKKTVDLGRLGTAVLVLLAQKDVEIAIKVSTNALEHNFSKSELEACLDAYADAAAEADEAQQFVHQASKAVDEPLGADDDVDPTAPATAEPSSPTGRTAYARQAVREFQEHCKRLPPGQVFALKTSGRDEHTVYQNAYAERQREVVSEAWSKQSRGQTLSEVERQALVMYKGPSSLLDAGYMALGGGALQALQKTGIFKVTSFSAGVLAAEEGQLLKAAANLNRHPIGSLAHRMAQPANRNVADAIGHRMQATGTSGHAFAPRMMAKDDSLLPRSFGGVGRSEGVAESSSGSRDVPVRTVKSDVSATHRELQEISNPGRIQTRINIMTGGETNKSPGIENAWRKHGESAKFTKSQFTIDKEELKTILQDKNVVQTQVKLDTASGSYVREVDMGRVVGKLPQDRGGDLTSKITIHTDKFGNLVTVYPGSFRY